MSSQVLKIDKLPDDLAKLKGWQILEIKFVQGMPSKLVMRINHLLADNPVDVIFSPVVDMKINEKGTALESGFNIKTVDVTVEPT